MHVWVLPHPNSSCSMSACNIALHVTLPISPRNIRAHTRHSLVSPSQSISWQYVHLAVCFWRFFFRSCCRAAASACTTGASATLPWPFHGNLVIKSCPFGFRLSATTEKRSPNHTLRSQRDHLACAAMVSNESASIMRGFGPCVRFFRPARCTKSCSRSDYPFKSSAVQMALDSTLGLEEGPLLTTTLQRVVSSHVLHDQLRHLLADHSTCLTDSLRTFEYPAGRAEWSP